MRLLLNEMYPPSVAVALREAGHDVIAAQEEDRLRGLPDPDLFGVARREERAIVTENAADYLELNAIAQVEGRSHYGLLITSNRSFPRHRNRFVGAVVRALEEFLRNHPEDEPTSGVWWLERP